VKSYQDAAGKLRAAHVLDQFDPSDTSQIPARREIVQQFLDANAAVKQVLTNYEDRFRADLTAAKVRDLKIQDFLDVLHSALARKNAILLNIRQCDDRISSVERLQETPLAVEFQYLKNGIGRRKSGRVA